jgi:hypothetical protein
MKSAPMNLELCSEVIPITVPGVRNAGRFQVIVEYSAGVCALTATADSLEEGVEAFMCQTPGCKEGNISLFDADGQRVVGSVRWRMRLTKIDLCVAHRKNVFKTGTSH